MHACIEDLTLEQKLLIAGGAVATIITIGAGLYLLMRKAKVDIAATEGGTTDPAPGLYEVQEGSQISILAIRKDETWFFNGWIVNGVSVGTDNPLVLTASGYQAAIASFTQTPENGGVIPVNIVAMNAPIVVTQWYACQWEWWSPTSNHGFISPVSEKHYPIVVEKVGKYGSEKLVFKVSDSSGKGVPNIPVEVWTNDVPDVNAGTVTLLDAVHTWRNPLVVKTLANGEARVPVGYRWVEPPNDLAEKFIHCTVFYYAIPRLESFWHCKQVAVPLYVGNIDGEGTSIAVPNYIYAKVQGTVLEALGVAQCQAGIYGAYFK